MNDIVKLKSGDLEVEIWTLGARVNGLWYQGKGSLVDSAPSVEAARGDYLYHGVIIGPVVNRIAGGTAQIGDRICTFEQNQGNNTLHSGAAGTAARNWNIIAQNDRFLTMSIELENGDGGFPGNRKLTTTYELIGSDLRVHLEAETDLPTWISMAFHPYWTLNQQGRSGQKLLVNADRYTPNTSETIPTGEVADVADTIFDLRSLGVPSYQIDNNYCLNETDSPAVILENDTGLRVTMTTDAPGMQIFTQREIGIAIEPQHWPDAMHHDDFPSIVLQPGRKYQQTSFYQFSQA